MSFVTSLQSSSAVPDQSSTSEGRFSQTQNHHHHDHDLHHQHHHEYRQYQPSLLEAAHLKADLARPTLLQQPPIKYEDDRDYRDIDESNHCSDHDLMTMMIIVMIS